MKGVQINPLCQVSTKIHVTSSVLYQMLSDKMVKITKNKRYKYEKLKTGARHINKWLNS